MKIAIIGFSGSGKSTLASALGKKYALEPLYLDRVHWLSGWVERDKDERYKIVKEYLDTSSSWIIDGNYTGVLYERRLSEADMIIILRFGRLACLRRAIKRKREFKGKSRPSMTRGCKERINFDFLMWLLFKGRTRKKCRALDEIAQKYKSKVTIIKNQRQLNAFYKAHGLSGEV